MSRRLTDFLVLGPVSLNSRANLLDSPGSTSVTSVIDLEARLNAFIRSALRKSRSGDYPSDVCMELLDKAWRAQKTVWRLRQQNNSEQ
jgi:hypothetical protein